MGISEMLSDLKAHLEHGEQLAASHLPALVEWAAKAEADPLVQAAVSLVVPEASKPMLASLLKSFEGEAKRIEDEATAAAQARAAAEAQAAADAAAAEPATADQ